MMDDGNDNNNDDDDLDGSDDNGNNSGGSDDTDGGGDNDDDHNNADGGGGSDDTDGGGDNDDDHNNADGGGGSDDTDGSADNDANDEVVMGMTISGRSVGSGMLLMQVQFPSAASFFYPTVSLHGASVQTLFMVFVHVHAKNPQHWYRHQHTRGITSTWKMSDQHNKDLSRLRSLSPGVRLRSLLLCLCGVCQALINSLVCWFCMSALGLVLFNLESYPMKNGTHEVKPSKEHAVAAWVYIFVLYKSSSSSSFIIKP